MKQIEYIAEIQEDGDLSLPESIRKKLGLMPSSQVRVVLVMPDRDLPTGDDAWVLFRRMGKDAVEGKLPDSAALHDQYLYGKKAK